MSGITDAKRERIAEILETRGGMSPETCVSVRQRAHDGQTLAEIADETPWAKSTIGDHAHGRCSHDIDPDPIPLERSQRSPITREECQRIRQLRDTGMQIDAIANEMECGVSTVHTHAHDHCSHSHESEETDRGESA